ncbi:MAG: alpha/beta fold hydrolase [Ilumatobacter sp.]|nr:alpha/beta fold hydrolase [Ilumatobacter sp.]
MTTAIGQTDQPELARGEIVHLPGRGDLFVRDIPSTCPGAPTVVLLHGWSSSADLNWHPYLAGLARHFRVIAFDQRAHGRGIRHDDPFRLEDCADDAAALIQLLGIDQAIVVGYSMGGPVGKLLWRRHPHLVGGLVLSSTSASFGCTTRLRVLFRAASAASAMGVTGPASVVARRWLSTIARINGVRGDAGWALDEFRRHDWGQLVEAGHQIGRYDSRDWVGEIAVPTAVIATMADEVVPTPYQLELARSIPGATLRRLSGGHHQCVTTPNRFEPVLVDACREVAARSTVLDAMATVA